MELILDFRCLEFQADATEFRR